MNRIDKFFLDSGKFGIFQHSHFHCSRIKAEREEEREVFKPHSTTMQGPKTPLLNLFDQRIFSKKYLKKNY